MRGVVYLVALFSILSVVNALPDNLGFEDGTMNQWTTNYTSFGQDYTSIASTDWSSEGNYSVYFGGTNGVFHGIPQHFASIEHDDVTVGVGDQVCFDYNSDKSFTVRLQSSRAGTITEAVPAGVSTDVCFNATSSGVLDLEIQGRLSAGCQGICLTKFYLDNIRIDSCTDGIQNGHEEGLDCGGSCPNACPTETLLEKYAPVLYFHPDEKFFPTSIDAMLNESDLFENDIIFDDLIDELPVDVNNLNASVTTDEYYLDLRNASGGYEVNGSVLAEIPSSSRFDHYPFSVYGRQKEILNTVFLQYWFFYPYNDWINKHEGDWEMIQVRLQNDMPQEVTYSFHFGGLTFNWSDIEVQNSTHPKAYVVKGGHGTWRTKGNHIWLQDINQFLNGCSDFVDETDDTGIVLGPENYQLFEINENTSWVDFPGIWGEPGFFGTGGPDSPANVKYEDAPNRWENPPAWAFNPNPTMYTACTGSPVNLHAYDENGNHVGIKNGTVETEIDGTYVYLPSNDESELLVVLGNNPVTFTVNGTGTGAFNFSIAFSDGNGSSKYALEYEDIPVNKSTTASLTLSNDNPNFVMQIDTDGDGTIDNTTTPDEINQEGNQTNNETDSDNDGFSDSIDNCPQLYNPNQETDFDSDGYDNLLCGGNDCNDNNDQINPNATESCNNIDDNCNSQTDENLDRVCGLTDVGICTFGTETCTNGNWTGCDAIFPQFEQCNNLDDDCDFEIDNGFNLGSSCSVGIGECKADGFLICSNDNQSSTCSAIPGTPSTEVCDNLDNDCNGIIDNSCSVNNKLQAIQLLQSEKDGFCNSKSRWRPCKDQIIDQIIERINNSLNPDYFIDNETLNPIRSPDYGLFVFKEEERASTLCNRWKKRVGIKDVCNQAQNLMKDADKVFAEIALTDAKNAQIQNPANQRCYDRRVTKAERHLDRANKIKSQLLSSWAIREYGKSWEFSQQAIKFASASRDIC